MSEGDNKVIEVINHYQAALNRYVSRGEEHKIMHCLDKLRRLPITVSHLEETGVGRTVNALRKVDGDVGDGARLLVNQWKEMVELDTHDNDAQDSDKDVEEMEECTENEENSSQNDIETSNLNSSDIKKSSSSSNLNGESPSKSDRHSKQKEIYDRRHNESSSSKKHDNFSSSKGSSSKSSKRKHEESSLKVVSENSENSEDSDERKNRKLKKSRESSPKSKNSGESENRHNKDKHSIEKTERYKEKHKESKDKKDKSSNRDKHEKEIVIESPKLQLENEHSHKKEPSKDKDIEKEKSYKKESTPSKSSNKKSSDKKEKRGKDERRTESKSSSSESTKKDKHSSSSSKSIPKSTTTSGSNSTGIKDKLKLVDSIDSGSGASFAEALGMLEPTPTNKSAKKKLLNNTKSDLKNVSSNSRASTSSSKRNSSPERSKEKEVYKEDPSFLSPMKNIMEDTLEDDDDYLSDENEFIDKIDVNGVPDLLTNPPKLDPLEINISSLLPTITPNYRPVPNNPLLNENPRHKAMTEYESVSNLITTKNARTKVYSGNKVAFGKMPSLFELCTRVLMDNIDALEYTGGVPYMILKPVLDKCTADQLLILEHFNPYLIEDTDGLWNFHCQKEFRTKKREEWESWREMYIRCVDEREAKLRALTANIKQSQDKSLPVRQTKLAYVDSVVKPPRSIARKQQKNGYTPDSKSPLITPSSRLSAIAQASSVGQVCVPNPSPRASSGTSSAVIKIKKAPLMQKTLQLMKGRFRR